VFKEKLMMVILVRGWWPLFAAFKGDVELSKEAWNLDFPPEKRKDYHAL